MLIELNIKNFALIQELSVEFGAGFNILYNLLLENISLKPPPTPT